MKRSIILGFTWSVETKPGVYAKREEERRYKADVLTYNKQYASNSEVNDDIQLRNRYSIVMSEKEQHYEDIKYVKIGAAKWKVTAIEFIHPRMILTVGGVYNGG